MKRLTKQQIEKKANLIEKAAAAQERLEEAVAKFNTEQRTAWVAYIEPAMSRANEAVDSLDVFRAELYEEMEAYHGDKSEKWQESEAGQNYNGWMESYATVLEPVEIEEPVEMECPVVEMSDIENATDSPE